MKRLFLMYSFLVLFVFLTITSVSAKECTTTELKELKELAHKVTVSYEPQAVSNEGYYFYTKAYNLDNKFYLRINDFEYVFYMSPEKELGSYKAGSNLKVEVYASNSTSCQGELLAQSTIKLPYYNKYSDRSECTGNGGKNICKKWYNTSNIDEAKFKELINQKENKNDGDNGILSSIVSLIKQYGLIALGVIVGVGLVVFTVIFIRNKRRTKIDL